MNALIAKTGFKFGCDPELFVFDPDGNPVSAEGLIPGTKNSPHKVEFGAVQVDGMAAEFNIDPVDNFNDWDRNITEVVKQLRAMLPKGFKLQAVPAVIFSQEVWDRTPDYAKELGCSPDFNAWTGEVNPPPSAPDTPTLRTASGHIHIGWGEEYALDDIQHLTNCRDLVKQLDWYLGGWSLAIDPDPVRRRLYGKAGACRYKNYGVEYRVLSNFWVLEKQRRLTVWNRIQQAIYDMRQQYLPDLSPYNNRLIEMINTSTRDSGMETHYRYPLARIA